MKYSIFPIACLCMLVAPALTAQTNPVALELGKPVQAELAAGQSNQYSIEVKAGQFVRVEVSQPESATVIRLSEPAKKDNLLELHWPGSSQRTESLCWIAKVAGGYHIEFAPAAPIAAADKYEITLEELRSSIADDQK